MMCRAAAPALSVRQSTQCFRRSLEELPHMRLLPQQRLAGIDIAGELPQFRDARLQGGRIETAYSLEVLERITVALKTSLTMSA